jgi:hypothetical protein
MSLMKRGVRRPVDSCLERLVLASPCTCRVFKVWVTFAPSGALSVPSSAWMASWSDFLSTGWSLVDSGAGSAERVGA